VTGPEEGRDVTGPEEGRDVTGPEEGRDAVRDVGQEQLRVAVDHPDCDGPAVLFSNGMGLILDYWDPVVRRLPGLLCIRFDRPGLGGSPARPSTSVEVEAEVDRLVAVADRLVPGRPLVLVGHSLGALFAQLSARLHPERVVGLVLVDPADPREYATDDNGNASLMGRALKAATQVPKLANVAGGAMERAVTFAATVRPDGPRLTTGQRRLQASPRHLASAIEESARSGRQCRQCLELEARHAMPDIPIRVLVGAQAGRLLRIRNDAWVKRSKDRIPAYGPGARMEVYRSAHLMMLDVPDLLAVDIIDVAAAARPEIEDASQMEADD
ncbi:MAG: alpha/beta fold hydrolase, partial [Candidatus Nanopelagicales bacterium]